ncbi:diaminohydroxyphosphoribosylaminopyrimidine deaminase / 5-amino-6-(5-phosphoribosylamino)uracil reductase (plasmid) [Rhizobium leguminosarum bv. trifolii WSM2304]|uniref:Diaminohydroxyphosphoribosylaminopyrimidine deaminase / 5-amino-6-(5-phosphoribosylamino)uracil reductase n=1 Tax=Rhizobium leguminosarum bv. trifolii (strain WSM2304) TaxID=395492 RepID=A0ABF7QY35_RHILW|nr:diaminohydroxyphosphoribosylaminopyrimidine deaminase / 5-amino-6-(5-phosphoribosylamino)uracil reductase [Rhizobium leguminosarum bv. trifolii WSM2304]
MYVHLVPPSALPGISPTGGEIGWSDPLAPTSIVWGDTIRASISPLVGEMSGRAEGGDTPNARGLCP